MLTQDIIEKSYYEQLMPGHYIDAKTSDADWKIAKINDKDNRYVSISFDGTDTKQQQMFLGSFRVAPLRSNTEGYTGSSYRAQRKGVISIANLKSHLEMMSSKFLNLPEGPSEIAFELTQYLRGQLFVNMHTILCFDTGFKPQEANQIMKFFSGFIDFIVQAIDHSLQYAQQYFDAPLNNKFLYLSHPRIALIYSLQQLLILVNYLIRIETPKVMSFFRLNKSIQQEQLIKKAVEGAGIIKLVYKLFMANDSNGKWFPFGVRKQAAKIINRFMPNVQLPKYTMKDYNEVFQIYPFMMENNLSTPKVLEEEYIRYMVSMLKEQSPFEAKLRSLQQLRKILEKQTKLSFHQPNNILDLLTDKGVVEHMLSDFNFNAQIFKRFVPILNFYCKSKALSQKQIDSLFKLAANRHQSELNTIYEIITGITQFAPTQLLDSIFVDICTLDINDQVTIQFIKNFTVKALTNHSNSKSFLSSFFGRKTSSSKYGFYGLNLLWKQMQDNGKISPKYISLCLQMIKALFNEQILHSQRQNYLKQCFTQIDKKKSFGQSLRIMHGIVNSYPPSAMFGETRRDTVEKLDAKYHILESLMKGLKSHKSLNFEKVSYKDTLRFFYGFLEQHSESLKLPVRVEHIEFLWTQGQLQLLMDFLRKNRSVQYEQWKKKYTKKLQTETIKEIFNRITIKKSFYERQLTELEFLTLDDLFVSLHFTLKNIEVNERGMIRYHTINNLIGVDFYFNFLLKCKNGNLYDKIVPRLIDIHLRPKSEAVDEKVNNWRKFLLRIVDILGPHPEVCIPTLQAFLTMVQGKMYRQNVTHQGNMDILVQNEGVIKTVSLAKNSSIFRLRKIIMQVFDLKNDFIMHNLEMKKDVTFVEEQDFSINAMNYRSKGPSIVLKQHRNHLHPHLQAVHDFKYHIAGEDKLYTLLFGMLTKCQNLHKEVWAIITILPTNRSFVQKLKNCSDFTRQNWQEVLCGKNNEQLLYFLNIITDMINNSDKWTEQMYKTEGVFTIDTMLATKLKEFDNPTLMTKLTKILLKVYEAVDKKKLDLDKIQGQVVNILSVLQIQFRQYPKQVQSPKMKDESPRIREQNGKTAEDQVILQEQSKLSDKNPVMPIQLFNDLISLLSRCSKLTKFQLESELGKEDLIFKCVEFALFESKTQAKPSLSEQIIIDLVITHYSSYQNRSRILQTIITQYLSVEYLCSKKSIENYFLFLIDMLHSLTNQEQVTLFSQQAIPKAIQQFIDDVLNGDFEDSSKSAFNELNWGALKLINYQNNSPSLNAKQQLFSKILSQLLFNKAHKRVKHFKTRKLLFQILKKMIYTQPSRVEQLNSYIAPKLQLADWRKSNYSSWILEPQKNQKKAFVGLQNLTATCYINCLFQQLFMTEQFRDKFMAVNSLGYREGKDQNQIYHLQNVFATLKYGNRRSCTTRPFCESFITYEGRPIDPSIQSDADEFFNALMEKIQMFLKQKQEMHIFENTFQGVLSNQLNCEGCPHRSQKQEHFLSIGVNIKNKKTLDEALQGYVDGQMLDGDNAYLCEPCNKKVRTMKRLCIKELPNVMVIVLKRFEFNYDDMRRIKINHELKYPQVLNMKGYTSKFLAGEQTGPEQDYTYNLKGVVVHSGTSEGGHYYSFIKDSNKWYEFNDQYISETTVKRVEEESFGGDQKDLDGQFKFQKYKSAYILFYDKKNKVEHPRIKMEPQEAENFAEQLQESVESTNSNIEFMSFVMEQTFVRLCENLAMLQHIQAPKFVLLYFHTTILRDKNRDQYAANLYRILDTRLQDPTLSQWFISQITPQFIREFYIEAPRIVRYLSLGLLIKAISITKQLPQNFFKVLVFSLSKRGMTPFAKVFKALSKNQFHREKLIALEYDKRVLNYLLEKKNDVQAIMCQKVDSYFGTEVSDKEKNVDFCPYAMIQSLSQFPLDADDAMKLIEQYNSRACYKIASKAIIRNSKDDLVILTTQLNNFAVKITCQDYRKESIDKYIIFMREVCSIDDDKKPQRIELCVKSLGDLMMSMVNVYDPMEHLIIEVHQLAVTSEVFADLWRQHLEKEAIPRRAILGWIKQSDKPHFLGKNEEWKRKTSGMTYGEKMSHCENTKSLMEEKSRWMFSKIGSDSLGFEQVNSELELAEVNSVVQLGSKKVVVKEHLGLLAKVQYEKQIRWCFVEKNDFQINYLL